MRAGRTLRPGQGPKAPRHEKRAGGAYIGFEVTVNLRRTRFGHLAKYFSLVLDPVAPGACLPEK